MAWFSGESILTCSWRKGDLLALQLKYIHGFSNYFILFFVASISSQPEFVYLIGLMIFNNLQFLVTLLNSTDDSSNFPEII